MSLAAAQVEARPGRLSEAVEAHVCFAKAAAGAGAKVLIFLELSLTGYSRTLGREHALDFAEPALRPLAEVSRELGIALVVGAPVSAAKGLMIASLCFRPGREGVTYIKKRGLPDVTTTCRVGSRRCRDGKLHGRAPAQEGRRAFAEPGRQDH